MKKLLKYKKAYIFILIALASLAMFFSLDKPLPAYPVANQGYLDLSDWDFEKNGNVKLDGEWEFYWDELLVPSDFTKLNPSTPDGYIKVPSEWDNSIGDAKLSDKGAATYR